MPWAMALASAWLADVDSRWPPASIPLAHWGSGTLFATHCSWLAQHVPAAYIRDYWHRARRLPALGHLHCLCPGWS